MLLLLALVGSSLSLPGLGRQQLHAVEMQCRGQRATAACSGSTIMYTDSRSPPKKHTGAGGSSSFSAHCSESSSSCHLFGSCKMLVSLRTRLRACVNLYYDAPCLIAAACQGAGRGFNQSCAGPRKRKPSKTR